jgi:hypothetical protein
MYSQTLSRREFKNPKVLKAKDERVSEAHVLTIGNENEDPLQFPEKQLSGELLRLFQIQTECDW